VDRQEGDRLLERRRPAGPRTFPEGAAHWAGLTGARANLTLWARTLLVDFFSPDLYAAHSVVTRPYRPSAVEWALVALTAAALAVALGAWRRRGREGEREERPERGIVAQAFLLYNAATLLTWSFANNDPIYTRFLYPSYAFLVLLGFYAYADVRRWTASPWGPVAFKLLYAALVVIHCLRNVEAVALPVRYGGLYPVRFLL
jgi:protein-S-isoprenylcysteine O-methyltransferase Ste14